MRIGTLVAEVPVDADIRVLTDAVQSLYPNANLTTKQEVERSRQPLWEQRARLTHRLTDRQQTSLKEAYYA